MQDGNPKVGPIRLARMFDLNAGNPSIGVDVGRYRRLAVSDNVW